MSGSHMARSAQKSRSSNGSWKVWVLSAALLVAVAALVLLLLELFGGGILGSAGGGDDGGTADIAPGIFTQVTAQYSDGRNAAGNIAVTQGSQLPPSVPAEDPDVVLLDFAWKDGSQQTEPVYLTVSDPSFTDGDGLTVYTYDTATAQWDTMGPYQIKNNSVTFQTAALSPCAFQVVSSQPQPTTPPEAVATEAPTPTPEPTPTPTPEPVAVVDYGAYPTVQTGVFTLAEDFSDGHTYVMALVENMDSAAPAQDEQTAEEGGDTSEEEGGVNISYVNAPESGEGEAAAPAEDANAPKATVLMNMGDGKMQALEMPLRQSADGTWYLGGPITEGMLWKATRDSYKDDKRFSMENNGSFINIDESEQNMILDDNDVRTRWLVQTAKVADGEEIDTVNYRDGDRFYITSLEMSYVALTDQAFTAGDAGATVSSPVYLGTEAPVDQTLVDQVLHFTVSKEQSEAKQVLIFELDEDMTVPGDVTTMLSHRVTVPVIDGNTNLSMLDIRDGDRVLQLGTDYTVAARVYNNSTVVVVISFMGEYSGQIVRTYPGTTFRTDDTQPTVAPEPTATPEPTKAPASSGGGGGGSSSSGSSSSGGSSSGGSSSGGNSSSPTDTGEYDDPTDA